jgi:hypothetical protein
VPLRPGGKIGALSSERIWRNFSLAPPLVVILLGIFGLGGSEQARQRIIEQLGYYIDPSGVKVFQDIANHAAEPKTGFWAAPGDTSDAKVQHSRYTVEAHPSGSNPGGVFNEFANLCAITSSAFSKGR